MITRPRPVQKGRGLSYVCVKSITKERFSVFVTDIFNQAFQKYHIRRILPGFYPFANHIAKDPAEVFMTGIAHEASGVGEHSDKVCKYGAFGKKEQLLFHTVLCVVIPPGTALLNFSSNVIFGKASCKSIDSKIVIWI